MCIRDSSTTGQVEKEWEKGHIQLIWKNYIRLETPVSGPWFSGQLLVLVCSLLLRRDSNLKCKSPPICCLMIQSISRSLGQRRKLGVPLHNIPPQLVSISLQGEILSIGAFYQSYILWDSPPATLDPVLHIVSSQVEVNDDEARRLPFVWKVNFL